MVLMSAGWYPTRKINTKIIQEELISIGCIWFKAVNDFLEEFGGLSIPFNRQDGSIDTICFDVERLIRKIDISWITDEYKNRLDSRDLCLVGQAYTGHIILFMDQEGVIYGGYDEEVFLIGENSYQAITTIIENLPIKEIP